MNIPKVTSKDYVVGSIKVKSVACINSESESSPRQVEADETSENERPIETYYQPAQLLVECIYPIKTTSDLELMEDVLEHDKNYWDLLVHDLYLMENGPLVKYLRSIMISLFDDEVMIDYTYEHRKNFKTTKKNFSNLNLCKVIFQAVLTHDKYRDSYTSLEQKIKAHLSQVSYRLRCHIKS